AHGPRLLGWKLLMLATGLLGLVSALSWAPPALAHAGLIESQPAHDARLAAFPEQVVLRFNEPVSPLKVNLLTPAGQSIELADIDHEQATVLVSLPESLDERGTYALSGRVVSADGHPIGGSLLFSVGAPTTAVEVSEQSSTARGFAIWLSRLLLYVGLFLGLGGAVFFALFDLDDAAAHKASRLTSVLICLGAGAVGCSLGLFGLDALDLPLSEVHRWQVWRIAVGSG